MPRDSLNVGHLEEVLPDPSTQTKPKTWRELREWDKMEEDEIRRFENMRERRSTGQLAWAKFKQNPVPYVLAPCIAYCIFAGLNALQTGHAYMAIKYLEYRIWTQGTAVASIFIGAMYYQRKERKELFKLQPYGPYRHQYGKSHIGYTSDRRYGLGW
mmetsp:Transcript_19016/g.30199  ORF Transcript_19016/g.30199 Transcript_19016/m.30199 type:complete len:157 (+) Transcript_19016:45-515(+)|eukprot:CAMPEP_0197025750 /NCGR_PEP_ID=MMETSP1384-20130603/5980_1 /TAXON_ID=29189 /ORGANISM="Ammonia sp." /LENGTH=156 /DNA_ID=CAMNT_0042454321 /DNA_START=36 /DNA_END=503 /DNA_ORIENTATION=-